MESSNVVIDVARAQNGITTTKRSIEFVEEGSSKKTKQKPHSILEAVCDWTIMVDTYEKQYRIPEDIVVSSYRPDIILYSRQLKRVILVKLTVPWETHIPKDHIFKMNFLKSSSVAIFATLMTMCCGHIGGSQLLLQDISPQVYCGRNLARVLAMLCYDDIFTAKRSEAGSMYNSILTPYYKDEEREAGLPWVPPHKARSMGLSRGKRFIVSECCDKACSVSELMSYC